MTATTATVFATVAAVRKPIFGLAFALLLLMLLVAASALVSGSATIDWLTVPWALILHVGTVVPALILGVPVLLMKKGTALHKRLGRIWATLMMITAFSSFWLQGLIGTIGPIHIFSVITLISIPRAIFAIRKGDVIGHQRAMIGPYIGMFIAGLFAFMPGRLLGDLMIAAL